MVSIASSRIVTGLTGAALLFSVVCPLHAKDFIKGERPQQRGYSQAVITEGGKLSDMVQMTVFITDVRYGDRLTQLRREILGDNFPGSALITVTALAVPEAKVEIQGYAVLGSK